MRIGILALALALLAGCAYSRPYEVTCPSGFADTVNATGPTWTDTTTTLWAAEPSGSVALKIREVCTVRLLVPASALPAQAVGTGGSR